jgi:hypothetical protein
LDVQTFEENGEGKLPIENIKYQLYAPDTFEQRLQRKEKPNSFVRPKMEFEFFEKEEIYTEINELEDDNSQVVIMLGGYG